MMFSMSVSFSALPMGGIRGDLPTACPPSLTIFLMYSSLWPFTYFLSGRSLGFGERAAAAAPSPFPEVPWQEAQIWSKEALPLARSPAAITIPNARAIVRIITVASSTIRFIGSPLLLFNLLLGDDGEYIPPSTHAP